MQAQHQANRDRLDECLTALQSTTDMQAKSALWKFYENCRTTWIKLDNEMVECRRRQRLTHKYTELQAEFDEYIKHFEQWLIMSKLMY